MVYSCFSCDLLLCVGFVTLKNLLHFVLFIFISSKKVYTTFRFDAYNAAACKKLFIYGFTFKGMFLWQVVCVVKRDSVTSIFDVIILSIRVLLLKNPFKFVIITMDTLYFTILEWFLKVCSVCLFETWDKCGSFYSTNTDLLRHTFDIDSIQTILSTHTRQQLTKRYWLSLLFEMYSIMFIFVYVDNLCLNLVQTSLTLTFYQLELCYWKILSNFKSPLWELYISHN
jgi:hypothetical protein